ncbi:BAI1-associated 3 [Brachionus plicatilis]|uniref:BAI1-associated 3 n=1 Tax=Brachionus plicatilis TaxID=10195 RepID=A0A3M7PDP4_BRAPC|nr:BAI1-associated 3 [Brachionus plicatilis]
MDKFSPLLNIRRSFKRDPLTKLASEHVSPHRSLSTKRLPFSTIKSAAQSDRKYLNDSLPNSPKQLSDSFTRFNYKTSSFHFCKRYSSKDDDNVGLFLEALENSIKTITEKKLNFLKEIENESTNARIQDEKHFSFYSNEPWLNISKEKKEQLYCEIIYTIQHKIGRTIDGHTDFIADLYKYAQQAFKMTAQDHERLFQLTSEEKAPILILNCEVLEACDLEAKDANGFSDPYCMLGIVPGNRKNSINQQSDTFTHGLSKLPTVQNFNINQSGQHSQSSHQKSSLIKRFSSFRRSEKSHHTAQALNFSKDSNLNKNKSSPNSNLKLTGISEKLPAKYIQTTNVKKATLNPVWKEEFRL